MDKLKPGEKFVRTLMIQSSQGRVRSRSVSLPRGSLAAERKFAGLVSSGLCQFNVTVPNIADGDQLVVVEVGGLRSQDNAYLPVRR